jgi:hypothetical protein
MKWSSVALGMIGAALILMPLLALLWGADSISATEQEPRCVLARIAESTRDDNRRRRFLHP